jgi:hypothetical protein
MSRSPSFTPDVGTTPCTAAHSIAKIRDPGMAPETMRTAHSEARHAAATPDRSRRRPHERPMRSVRYE